MNFFSAGIIYLIGQIITAVILFFIIRFAVKTAIVDAWKTIKKIDTDANFPPGKPMP